MEEGPSSQIISITGIGKGGSNFGMIFGIMSSCFSRILTCLASIYSGSTYSKSHPLVLTEPVHILNKASKFKFTTSKSDFHAY